MREVFLKEIFPHGLVAHPNLVLQPGLFIVVRDVSVVCPSDDGGLLGVSQQLLLRPSHEFGGAALLRRGVRRAQRVVLTMRRRNGAQ